jgi:hypothetical protein
MAVVAATAHSFHANMTFSFSKRVPKTSRSAPPLVPVVQGKGGVKKTPRGTSAGAEHFMLYTVEIDAKRDRRLRLVSLLDRLQLNLSDL